ncbi:hypothetical protein, partial [Erwinia amylovora]
VFIAFIFYFYRQKVEFDPVTQPHSFHPGENIKVKICLITPSPCAITRSQSPLRHDFCTMREKKQTALHA